MGPLQSFYLPSRFFQVIGGLVALFTLSFGLPGLYNIALILFFATVVLTGIDILLLYRPGSRLTARRQIAKLLSNGDDNPVSIHLSGTYPFPVRVTVIDELPPQLQIRDFKRRLHLPARSKESVQYTVHPVKRGNYPFGYVNLFAESPLGLVQRRFRAAQPQNIPVYPSFLQMRRYELIAFSSNLSDYGLKKIRRIGHNIEFETIKEYVPGDDYRTVNWKASARRGNLMVNQYQDERSQQVYMLIDKGRVMKMPFEQMTLLDYAINATLMMSNIALKKDDKAGLLTFSQRTDSFIPASRRGKQLKVIQETLYSEQTDFREPDFERLYVHVKHHIRQRSLLMVFTNFETLSSAHRQLPYFRRLAKQHLVVVVFFENTELDERVNTPAGNLEEVYQKTIAEKFQFEKKLIARKFNQYGIYTVLTSPGNLLVNTLNKYLELKARGLI